MFGSRKIRIIAINWTGAKNAIFALTTDFRRIACTLTIHAGIKIAWMFLFAINASFAMKVWIAKNVMTAGFARTVKGVTDANFATI